ncbi:GvpL/GvpF family gas vesicle protein [bacterium]|nr:GvpL/GvpF family gas vesicle protein [bacterium]
MRTAQQIDVAPPTPTCAQQRPVHLYCFAQAHALGQIAAVGVDGRSPVSTLETEGIAAVFSSVPPDEVRGERADSAMQDPEWIIPRACRHEAVIEEAMSRSPVLPVRFGAVFSSTHSLSELLAGNVDEVARHLDYVRDKEEWAVKVLADAGQAELWLTSNDPLLRAQREQMPESQGARYFHERRLRTEVQKRVKVWCAEAGTRVREELGAHAVDVCPLRPQPRGLSGRETDMALNCAFLLQSGSVEEFRRRVQSINSELAEQGLTLEASGPWPPYSFCPALGAPPAAE